MRQDPLQVLIAGATGTLGHEVLRRLAGGATRRRIGVLAREPIRAGLHGIDLLQVPDGEPDSWPAGRAVTAIVLFDPPRLFYQRERALWTPRPDQLPALAAWLRASGVRTLAIVLPHAQGRLPEALKRGLASLDEQAVAALGFERLIVLRSPRKPGEPAQASPLVRIARFMLSALKYMVPSSEQPVRAAKMAQLLVAALELAPPGIHIAAPELVWRASQGDLRAVARDWLHA